MDGVFATVVITSASEIEGMSDTGERTRASLRDCAGNNETRSEKRQEGKKNLTKRETYQ